MARLPQSDLGATPYKKIIGHNPELYEKWISLEKEFFKTSHLGDNLLEQVRRVSAWNQNSEY